MVSCVYRPARGGRSCEHFGGYKTINRIPIAENFTPPCSHDGFTIIDHSARIYYDNRLLQRKILTFQNITRPITDSS